MLEVHTRCPHCKREATIYVDRAGYYRWINGEMIHHALPETTLDERELLMSGICSTCWDKEFGGDEDGFWDKDIDR